MNRIFGLFLLAAVCAGTRGLGTDRAQSQGKAERRDALFLRFPEMAQRYWVNSETNAASHKVVAVPMPRQCAFVYADSYSQGQMSESEVAADRGLELQPQARGAGAARRELQCRLSLPGRDQQRALRRAAQFAADRFLRPGVDLLPRRSRQHRAPERPGQIRRLDRPRPLGHLRGRQSARRAGLRGHLHQRRAGRRPLLDVLLRRQVQRHRHLPEQDGRAQRPYHRARPDQPRAAGRRW